MKASVIKTIGVAAICLAASLSQAQEKPAASKAEAQPTGTTGATAFQPTGSGKAEAEAGSAQNGNAGMKEQAKPGFDNKPPKGAKANCHRPQGGVDASGGENIASSSKDNTACTGKADKKSK
ncbi:hypothetical protein [Duganella aceris]|jgi:hypothetical protein|uniref:Homeobox protein YbgS n=1 Tax=Duganella aceris TaxID=2703883 RepID=A0ABX0FHK3_9BURK|nr:hypothetical protein [Duganella aceris]NGZ83988.1 hypothetical protein [Duganella aceris]